jgi:protein-arginine kinase
MMKTKELEKEYQENRAELQKIIEKIKAINPDRANYFILRINKMDRDYKRQMLLIKYLIFLINAIDYLIIAFFLIVFLIVIYRY